MARPARIVFFFEDLCYGGTQKQNLELACRMDRDLFAPSVLTLTGRTDLDSQAEEAGLPIVRIGDARRVPALFFLKLRKKLAQLQPDILLTCTALPNIWGRIWGSVLKTPLIIGTCRGGGAPARQHERWLWRLADHIICNSRPLLDLMSQRGVPRERMTYIANGVDVKRFSPSPESSPEKGQRIVCVGRLAPDKDHLTLLNAFRLVLTKYPDARLRLVGEGPDKKKLLDFVDKVFGPSREKVEFVGASADPSSHLKRSDIFALSSVREGQPNAIIEAMSSGLPVCATAVGGIPDLLEQGRLGLLSPARDAQALAANLLTLMDQPDLAKSLGRLSREKAARDFSFEAMTDAHQNLIRNLAHERNLDLF